MSIREANEVLEHLVKREEENRKAKDETLQGFEDKNEPPSQKDINKQDVAHLIRKLSKLQFAVRS